MKQTAVEWLVEKLSSQPIENINDEYWFGIIGEAKAIEREQIENAIDYVYFDENGNQMTGEQYYNQTYGGNNE